MYGIPIGNPRLCPKLCLDGYENCPSPLSIDDDVWTPLTDRGFLHSRRHSVTLSSVATTSSSDSYCCNDGCSCCCRRFRRGPSLSPGRLTRRLSFGSAKTFADPSSTVSSGVGVGVGVVFVCILIICIHAEQHFFSIRNYDMAGKRRVRRPPPPRPRPTGRPIWVRKR
jgi:hypothetical protein